MLIAIILLAALQIATATAVILSGLRIMRDVARIERAMPLYCERCGVCMAVGKHSLAVKNGRLVFLCNRCTAETLKQSFTHN